MIQITAKNCIGIVLYATKYQDFRIMNSTSSTGNIGVYIFDNTLDEVYTQKAYQCAIRYGHRKCKYSRIYKVINYVNIINILFQSSCLILTSKQWTYQYRVTDTTFVGCECSSVVSIHGILTVKLKNMTILGSQTNLLLNSTVKSLVLEGRNYFYNNGGGLYINSSSNVNFSGTTASFINNTVTVNNTALPGTIIFTDSNSSITFSNSHINFENNHGHLCGEISARNATILMENASIGFLDNHGEKSSAMLLIESQFKALPSGEGTLANQNHYSFYSNSGPIIVSSHSQILFHDIKMEFVDNIVTKVKEEELTGSIVCSNNSFVTFDNTIIFFLR